MTLALATLRALADRVIDDDSLHGDPVNQRLPLRDGAPFDARDTWRSGCPAEAALGEMATAALRMLMAEGATVHVLPGTCGFDRGCAWVELSDRTDAGELLLALGLTQPEQNADWCGR
ncbi:hypothetical protein [Jannaschia seohaensis]|uniref:hypothetical protein n=1 Tax=Jannaschia seohaensis TaxID=475081 RepID=UPI0011B25DBD|nr:hypothetical protein [Jannaschia seohaensis]